ncbi:sigma 54-interacting transcriptional regulator [Longimicrobium terrae]|uniref:Magnesium chelatase subunit I n=1 Tax=Longimicrobium terrae TaxID=1639882 RepID=A0A841H1C1_9BACT|nr:sigma 54-interacting transcriptional regulator [Longimicrobium terrae]MBB4637409.1 magnesium chelatase subunit I [Longimicrobium terrae]MBB6071807.1 magnesium chelatase subunit I [Longimicrobium terrae]NNC28566.1 sigma 54-interacting transcriptional regulator [Longimicrobium terrae]
MTQRPTTLGALRAAGYRPRSVKAEIRDNLVARLKAGGPLFPGIVGYEDSVVPSLVNAVLSRHNFILLGLRGQAKSRILRQLATLLDPEIPVLAGSEVNDDPFAPISKHGRQLIEQAGDDAPIEWIGPDRRYVEKLATPDVTVADLIGDMDPIRAARGGHLLSDELTINFGLLPRANRGIFAINELPDLSGKVQVGLFNVLQEGDIQIKGYPVRLPLDVMLVFSANPEDYTARGKIITPLKDRIGAEILTHYPRSAEEGMEITANEAWVNRADSSPVSIPPFVSELVERVAFLARGDKRIDRRSGVSQRMPITVLETAVSNAERRALLAGEDRILPRVADVYAAMPSITGKMELEYEGELQGSEAIARDLIAAAAREVFDRVWDVDMLDTVIEHFDRGGVLQISDGASAEACMKGLRGVPGLAEALEEAGMMQTDDVPMTVAAAELLLEGLAAHRRISRAESGAYGRAKPERKGKKGKGDGGFTFGDDMFS